MRRAGRKDEEKMTKGTEMTADDLAAMRAANADFAAALDVGDLDAALAADDRLITACADGDVDAAVTTTTEIWTALLSGLTEEAS
jgi:DNA-binding GntR family transcriptional regulator